jgi:hypothetical protein
MRTSAELSFEPWVNRPAKSPWRGELPFNRQFLPFNAGNCHSLKMTFKIRPIQSYYNLNEIQGLRCHLDTSVVDFGAVLGIYFMCD